MTIKSNLLVDEPDETSPIPDLYAAEFLPRLWRKDHTLWSDTPTEIDNRLGWLDSPQRMQAEVPGILGLVDDVRRAGLEQALLLGMGGSSLAPEVFANTFGVAPGYLDLHILDTTDPAAIRAAADAFDPAKTLYIVSTKSGGTVETLSLFKYFYTRASQTLGPGRTGRHFIAITDPGSSLAALAAEHKFRHTFLNDPDIGGRYSALSFFGLAPAALLGVDITELLRTAQRAADMDGPTSTHSLGLALGAIVGMHALRERDKLTLQASPYLAPVCDWVEQLVAESTGKSGIGILPVTHESMPEELDYGNDRQFVVMAYEDDENVLGSAANLFRRAPVTSLILEDEFDLGALFFHWQVATVVAAHMLAVHPFDQPDVESAKIQTRSFTESYLRERSLPAGETTPLTADNLAEFLERAEPRGYIAIQAYLDPRPETTESLRQLQTSIAIHTGLACTVGYGPRFLHSTGQLHKGDAGKGLFIQFVSTPDQDLPIPDEPGSSDSQMTFGVLKQAQALGDAAALRAAGRPVITFLLDEADTHKLLALAEQL